EIPALAWSACFDMRDAQGQPVPPERLPTARILRGEVLEGPTAVDLTLRTLDGRLVEANVTGAPVQTTDDGIVGAVAVYRDMTERRHLERQTWEALRSLLGMAEILVDPDTAAETSAQSAEGHTSKVIQRLAELTRSLLGCTQLSVMAQTAQ